MAGVAAGKREVERVGDSGPTEPPVPGGATGAAAGVGMAAGLGRLGCRGIHPIGSDRLADAPVSGVTDPDYHGRTAEPGENHRALGQYLEESLGGAVPSGGLALGSPDARRLGRFRLGGAAVAAVSGSDGVVHQEGERTGGTEAKLPANPAVAAPGVAAGGGVVGPFPSVAAVLAGDFAVAEDCVAATGYPEPATVTTVLTAGSARIAVLGPLGRVGNLPAHLTDISGRRGAISAPQVSAGESSRNIRGGQGGWKIGVGESGIVGDLEVSRRGDSGGGSELVGTSAHQQQRGLGGRSRGTGVVYRAGNREAPAGIEGNGPAGAPEGSRDCKVTGSPDGEVAGNGNGAPYGDGEVHQLEHSALEGGVHSRTE